MDLATGSITWRGAAAAHSPGGFWEATGGDLFTSQDGKIAVKNSYCKQRT